MSDENNDIVFLTEDEANVVQFSKSEEHHTETHTHTHTHTESDHESDHDSENDDEDEEEGDNNEDGGELQIFTESGEVVEIEAVSQSVTVEDNKIAELKRGTREIARPHSMDRSFVEKMKQARENSTPVIGSRDFESEKGEKEEQRKQVVTQQHEPLDLGDVPKGLLFPESDVYGGLKLRRRASLNRKYYYDYEDMKQSEFVRKNLKVYGDKKFIMSVKVNKFSKKLKSDVRILMVTEQAIYEIKKTFVGMSVSRRTPLKDILTIASSRLSDDFFLVHSFERNDRLYESARKTEIIQTIMEQSLNTPGHSWCGLNVANRIEFNPGNKTYMLNFKRDDASRKKIEVDDLNVDVKVNFSQAPISIEEATASVTRKSGEPFRFELIESKSVEMYVEKYQKEPKFSYKIIFYANQTLQEPCVLTTRIGDDENKQDIEIVERDQKYEVSQEGSLSDLKSGARFRVEIDLKTTSGQPLFKYKLGLA